VTDCSRVIAHDTTEYTLGGAKHREGFGRGGALRLVEEVLFLAHPSGVDVDRDRGRDRKLVRPCTDEEGERQRRGAAGGT